MVARALKAERNISKYARKWLEGVRVEPLTLIDNCYTGRKIEVVAGISLPYVEVDNHRVVRTLFPDANLRPGHSTEIALFVPFTEQKSDNRLVGPAAFGREGYTELGCMRRTKQAINGKQVVVDTGGEVIRRVTRSESTAEEQEALQTIASAANDYIADIPRIMEEAAKTRD